MSITLRAKVGENMNVNFHLTKEQRLSIHLIAGEKGFNWKITQSKIVEAGNIKKWDGVGKPFVFMFGETDPEIKKKLDDFLLSVGIEGHVKERFELEMSKVRDRAVLRWAAGRYSKESI